MLNRVFNSSPYLALNETYSGKFKPWELKLVSSPRNYWNLKTGIEATKWLIEENLIWSELEIKENLSAKTFSENGLSSMLDCVFHQSPYEALEAAYPKKFQPWELSCIPKDYWNVKTGVRAIKWLIEEKLKWSEEEIKQILSQNTFDDNGLSGMLRQVFNGSPYIALCTTYPGRFIIEEFKNYQRIKESIIEHIENFFG